MTDRRVRTLSQPQLGRQLILTCPAPAESGSDIYSRVFAPASGVPEDPVVRGALPRSAQHGACAAHYLTVPLWPQTGAAHTALAPFWLLDKHSISRLPDPTRAHDTSVLRAKQVSRRGGELIVKLEEKNKRVELQGSARRVMRGVLEL